MKKDLDAWPFPGPEACCESDGKSIILRCGSDRRQNNARRQVTDAPERWLKLYRFDLESRRFSLCGESALRSD